VRLILLSLLSVVVLRRKIGVYYLRSELFPPAFLAGSEEAAFRLTAPFLESLKRIAAILPLISSDIPGAALPQGPSYLCLLLG
jgi:hypothetical protein